MRKWVVGLAAFALVLGGSAGVWAGPEAGGVRIALHAPGAVQAGLTARHELANGRVSVDVTPRQLAKLDRLGIAYDLIPVRTVDASSRTVKGKPGVHRAAPSTQVPYGIKMIYGDPGLAPAAISGGNGIKVAVLDTGSVDHPDFTRPDGSKVIVECLDFSNRRADVLEESCADGHGHGTHVIGTIAAAGGADGQGVFGVAPGASIMSYKVMADNGRGYADDVARAIRMAADHGANIISLSLGASTPSVDEQEAIGYATGKGALVIAAAGNAGPEEGTIGYPGAFADVVAVAALNPDEVVAYFSSRGVSDGNDMTIAEREVEVAGPGRSIISTYKDGGYRSMSGTSMATPHITGLAAKMWQGSAAATRAWLQQSARAHDITRAERLANAAEGYDIASGYGLPQVNAVRQEQWSN